MLRLFSAHRGQSYVMIEYNKSRLFLYKEKQKS